MTGVARPPADCLCLWSIVGNEGTRWENERTGVTNTMSLFDALISFQTDTVDAEWRSSAAHKYNIMSGRCHTLYLALSRSPAAEILGINIGFKAEDEEDEEDEEVVVVYIWWILDQMWGEPNICVRNNNHCFTKIKFLFFFFRWSSFSASFKVQLSSASLLT